MRKKLNAILTIVLIATILLITLASCATNRVDYFDYSENNLGVVGKLVQLMHKWIGNYGWTVVVFTGFLKLIMLPLDIWQRYSSRKSSVKMQSIQPLMESIDKRYGANTQRANEEKQKLYKKQGYSMLSTCLPMIISMVIFFVMFGGLREYSTHSTIMTFRTLSNEYYNVQEQVFKAEEGSDVYEAYVAEYDARYAEKMAEMPEEYKNPENPEDAEIKTKIANYEELARLYAQIKACNKVNGINDQKGVEANEIALKAVQEKYLEERESWLWIKNVWQPDTWETVMPDYSSGANAFSTSINMTQFPDDEGGATYNRIRNAILSMEGAGYGANGTWNGLMILPILSVGLSFLSMWLSQYLEKRGRKNAQQGEASAQNQQQQATNKMMMIMMPLMMAAFGFMYTGAFAIYMVCNYTLSIISTVGLRYPVEKMVEKSLAKSDKKDGNGKASYMR